MYKITIFVMLIVMCSLSVVTEAQRLMSTSPLKILFVGYDPHRMPQQFRQGADEFTIKDSGRMAAFRGLLANYFATVQTMDCRDWKPADSDPYDVTIFDYRTTPVGKASDEGSYLPDNFSKPVVFIGGTGAIMGRSVGLKIDWYCLCLAGEAHHIKSSHPIFNGPMEKVVPTMTVQTTPEDIYHYANGDTVPHSIPMWTVQTQSFRNNEKYRIGLVARGDGFDDSPDAEVISGGYCMKDVGAVAIGRHGNFLLWGFSSSPLDMTEEGKKVFVNTVAYIDRFSGQKPFVHERNEYITTRERILDAAAAAKWSMYQEYLKANAQAVAFTMKAYDSLKAKKAAGQTLTSREEEEMKFYASWNPKEPTYQNFLQMIMGPLYKQFGMDTTAFQHYIHENIDYMCPSQGQGFGFTVDEDVKKLRMSNHDVRLLKTCIGMLKEGRDTAMAKRILLRYTDKHFVTAKEWQSWYDDNSDRLFFTERGGFKFLINPMKG